MVRFGVRCCESVWCVVQWCMVWLIVKVDLYHGIVLQYIATKSAISIPTVNQSARTKSLFSPARMWCRACVACGTGRRRSTGGRVSLRKIRTIAPQYLT